MKIKRSDLHTCHVNINKAFVCFAASFELLDGSHLIKYYLL